MRSRHSRTLHSRWAASFYSPSGSCRPGSWSRCWPPPARFLVLCETSATTLGMGNATAPMMRSPFRQKLPRRTGSRQSTGSTSMPKTIVDRRAGHGWSAAWYLLPLLRWAPARAPLPDRCANRASPCAKSIRGCCLFRLTHRITCRSQS